MGAIRSQSAQTDSLLTVSRMVRAAVVLLCCRPPAPIQLPRLHMPGPAAHPYVTSCVLMQTDTVARSTRST